MRSTLISVFVALLLPIGLAGCLPTGGDVGTKITDTPPSTFTATPGLTPRERNLKAVELLNEGKAQEARVELEASLAESPADKNPLAQNLISQIDVDPVTVLGTDHFTHTVEKGESLSAIAGKYLGDLYKFYILALYNDMNNPSQLQVGQKIRVPGKEPRVAAATPEAPPPPPTEPPKATAPPLPTQPEEPPVVITSPPPTPPEEPPAVITPPAPPAPSEEQATEQKMKLFAEAREKSDSGNYPGAIEIIEVALTQFPEDQMFRVFGGDVYGKYGGSLLGEHKYKEALVAAERGAALNPDNPELNAGIDDAKKGVQADSLYQDGQKYEASKSYIDAYESYQAALKLWPAHDPAQIALAKVTPEVAGVYYRECREAFQRQCLNEALKLCEEALKIDPGHEPAKLMHNRANELREKLGTSSC